MTEAALPVLTEVLAYNADRRLLACDSEVRIAFLRNFTIEGLEPYLTFHCLKNGIRPNISFSGYDTMHQELLDPSSYLHGEQTDLIVLSLVLETLDAGYGEPGWRCESAKARIRELFETVAAQTASLIAVNTFIQPFDRGIASTAGIPEGADEVSHLNRFIRDFVEEHKTRFFVTDWERSLQICGEQEAIDYRFWYMSKALFKHQFLDLYALDIFKIVRALKGKAKKCLLLDCDNTLWGGIAGEDGLSGIRLDPHTYPGNVFYDFQKKVLRLHERGVLLALVSKNNEEDVWEILDRHPYCVLKREHLSAWRINWADKASNIRSLSDELNLGLDSFVFVDDNPVECEFVRTTLPDVTVLQVPAKLYLFPRILSREGIFDTLSVTDEDLSRSELYRAEARRKQVAASCGTLDEYLATLDLVALISEAKEENFERVAQLTQKTNQFNLTTRRYSATQIREFACDKDCAVYILSVRDRFGDSGLTGVLIARREGTAASIDSFLMSCRVLGRNLEVVFLDHCLTKLEQKWAPSEWRAEYRPTRKNAQTSNLYPQAGFTTQSDDDTVTTFRCEIARRYNRPISYITVEDTTDGNLP